MTSHNGNQNACFDFDDAPANLTMHDISYPFKTMSQEYLRNMTHQPLVKLTSENADFNVLLISSVRSPRTHSDKSENEVRS